MIIGIHQPNYLPWVGYFKKILHSDVFVFLDCVQFTKGGYQNRVKVKGPEGDLWLTQLIAKNNNNGFEKINKIKFNNIEFWANKHLKTIQSNYKRAKYFDSLFPILNKFYNDNKLQSLCDFNIGLIKLMCAYMKIEKKPFYKSSELNTSSGQTERLVSICKTLNGTEYLSGQGGKNYQDISLFEGNNIRVKFVEGDHPVYKQCWKGFLPGLSIIDLCFNEGPDGKKLLL